MKRLAAALVLLVFTAGICLASRLALDSATEQFLDDGILFGRYRKYRV